MASGKGTIVRGTNDQPYVPVYVGTNQASSPETNFSFKVQRVNTPFPRYPKTISPTYVQLTPSGTLGWDARKAWEGIVVPANASSFLRIWMQSGLFTNWDNNGSYLGGTWPTNGLVMGTLIIFLTATGYNPSVAEIAAAFSATATTMPYNCVSTDNVIGVSVARVYINEKGTLAPIASGEAMLSLTPYAGPKSVDIWIGFAVSATNYTTAMRYSFDLCHAYFDEYPLV